MRYIICDIDGTIADSTHRNDKLPAFIGKKVTAAADRGTIKTGDIGIVMDQREIDGASQRIVSVRWRLTDRKVNNSDLVDQAYVWNDFMSLTGQSWTPWHEGMRDDTPIPHTMYILKALRPQLLKDNIGVLFLTARWESYRADTQHSLEAFGATCAAYPDLLRMRQADDERKDILMKGDVLNKMEKEGHSFFFAFEDRRSVAEFYRGRGIPTFHMADT